ncbi:AcrR family transcriptional regulator [Nocardioides luteus]|uniref:HTH tetR-type domain-containing protein n=1 Tax=Nocardioides luteus TaxID=1844 RepID=A0ABQ5SYK9_9ACTN|nr:TetR/AcrR family transcriptional regulator [Nocardioides luteus]MDR7312816.1 AcrR family transcriptional regulator [Nocardioides luteus]GGR47751.1 hypothetical protein GCM10010197_12050 [Nocardioides luteus]GLJ69069.1 hypothetical protein GCM10017579_31050 [Nocardioides luteus]
MAHLRATQKEMTRRLLLDAAMDRFLASGYAATTVDEIASAAGTTRVTFYAYFPSKSEIIKALITERLNDELSRLRTPESTSTIPGLVDAVASGTREQIGAWIRETAAHWPVVRPIITISRAAQAVDPELTEVVDSWMDIAIGDVAAGLAKADRFAPDCRRFLGALAMGQFDYVSQHWHEGDWGVGQERMCELLTDSWVKLLGEPS